MTISRDAKERHLACAIAALTDEDFEFVDHMVFAMLRRENEARAALVLAGLAELREAVAYVSQKTRAAQRTAPAHYEWPSLIELRDE